MEKISVLGLGYIGLPTAILLAKSGYEVCGVDVAPQVVESVNDGRLHIVEPGLDEHLASMRASGRLHAATKPAKASVFVIAVPTPIDASMEPDLRFVNAAFDSIIELLEPGNLVLLESTSPVGTTRQLADCLQKARPELADAVHFAYCPERVIPGRVWIELVENDRVVGGLSEAATAAAVRFYNSFVKGQVLATTAETAELCKLSENAYRDVNIAYANELSMVSHQHGVDVWELIRLANHHPRVNILKPGPGVGGHCIAVDPWFIAASAPENTRLIQSARAVNDNKPEWVMDQVMKAAQSVENPTIACLGLSFKADVDDLRESPALSITQKLMEAKLGTVIACEPNIEAYEGLELYSLQDCLERANIVLILVDHMEFGQLREHAWAAGVQVIDTRGLLAS